MENPKGGSRGGNRMPRTKAKTDVQELEALRDRLAELEASEAREEATEPEPEGETLTTITFAAPQALKDAADRYSAAKRTTLSDTARRGLADAVGFDLSSVQMRTRGRRSRFNTEEERQEAAKLRYQQERALIQAAKEVLAENSTASKHIREMLKRQGVPTLS